MVKPPIPISTDGGVSASAVLFRYRGKLQLTVVVKAAWTLVPGGNATHAGPGEIVADERTFDRNPTRSVEIAGDLAPYRARCDVTFVGHAHAPGGRPAPSGSVRLGLAREDGRMLVDKVLHVFGDRAPGASAGPFTKMPLVYERAFGGPGEANPVGTETPNVIDPRGARRPAGYAPISRFWPARKQLLRGVDRAALEAPIAVLPDAMPWDYYQSAPLDQQVEPLRGGEWLVLDGIHPTLPRLQTRLPVARGAARVLVRGAAPAPIEMTCDTLAVDGDRLTAALVWRGRYEIAGDEAALGSITVAAALESPGAAIDWARLFATAAPAVAPAAPKEEVGEGTMAVSPEKAAEIAQRAATPFAAAGAPSSVRSPASSAATPWGAAPLQAAPRVAVGEGTIAADGAGESTFALRPAQQASAAARPVAPFAIAAPDSAPVSAPSSSGLPFGGAHVPAPTPAAAGEETIALGVPTMPRPAAVAAPITVPVAVAAPPVAAAAPTVVAAPPAPRSTGDTVNRVVPKLRPPAVAAPSPAPRVAPPSDTLADRLRAAGASAADVSALLQVLAPPPLPPDED